MEHAVSFAFVMPGWKETTAYARLSASKYLRRAVTVAAADHGFCDGASHQRQDPFRASPYGIKKWPMLNFSNETYKKIRSSSFKNSE